LRRTNRSSRTGALVLGANYRALGVVRSLGRRHIPVRLVKNDDASIASLSRYAKRTLRWTAGGEEAQLEHLLGLASRHGLEGWTVIPTDDDTVALVSRGRQRLSERFIVAAPEWETMQWAYDKRLTYRLGRDLGIDQPRTWFAASLQELEAIAPDGPAILKPGVQRSHNQFVHEKAWPVRDRAMLRARYEAAQAFMPADEIMLQELIPGDGQSQLSFGALAREGRVLASITARRARQHPMDFGRQSTYVESISSPDVADAARRLIEGMRYTGLVEIEFKRDIRDGLPKLLDINARAWGWHSIGARAGVDFPYLEWRMVHDEPVPEAHAEPGVRWIRMATDLPTVAREIYGGRMSLGSYIASLRGPLEHAMMSRDDPLPGLADVPLTALIQIRRGLRKLGRGQAGPE
jgi:predicted ATP-grasp superfamily ATP-dependent carboligase